MVKRNKNISWASTSAGSKASTMTSRAYDEAPTPKRQRPRWEPAVEFGTSPEEKTIEVDASPDEKTKKDFGASPEEKTISTDGGTVTITVMPSGIIWETKTISTNGCKVTTTVMPSGMVWRCFEDENGDGVHRIITEADGQPRTEAAAGQQSTRVHDAVSRHAPSPAEEKTIKDFGASPTKDE